MYVIDVTENIANKVCAARENVACIPMITNVQDFVVNCEKALVTPADKVFASEMEIPEMEYVETGREDAKKGELQ